MLEWKEFKNKSKKMSDETNISAALTPTPLPGGEGLSSVIPEQSGVQPGARGGDASSPLFPKEGLGEISIEEVKKLIEGSRLSEENKGLAFEILEQNNDEDVLKSIVDIVRRAEEKFDGLEEQRTQVEEQRMKNEEEAFIKIKKLEEDFDAKIAMGYQKLQKHIEDEMTKIEEKQEEALLEEVKNL